MNEDCVKFVFERKLGISEYVKLVQIELNIRDEILITGVFKNIYLSGLHEAEARKGIHLLLACH